MAWCLGSPHEWHFMLNTICFWHTLVSVSFLHADLGPKHIWQHLCVLRRSFWRCRDWFLNTSHRPKYCEGLPFLLKWWLGHVKHFNLRLAPPWRFWWGWGDSKKEFLDLWLFFSSEYRLSCLNCSLNFLIVIIQNSRRFFSLTGLDALSNFNEKDWSSVSSTFSRLEHIARGDGSESEVLRLVSKF